MSGTAISVLAFGALVLIAIVLEMSARRRGRPATAAETVAATMRTTPGRVAVLASWVWVGVHVLAR